MSKTTTVSFRIDANFAEETSAMAGFVHQNRSDYIVEAVREKNERTLAERMAFLSKVLSAKSLAAAEAMDETAGDGLA